MCLLGGSGLQINLQAYVETCGLIMCKRIWKRRYAWVEGEVFQFQMKVISFLHFQHRQVLTWKGQLRHLQCRNMPPWNAGWGTGFLSDSIIIQPKTNVSKVSLSLLLVEIIDILSQRFFSLLCQICWKNRFLLLVKALIRTRWIDLTLGNISVETYVRSLGLPKPSF